MITRTRRSRFVSSLAVVLALFAMLGVPNGVAAETLIHPGDKLQLTVYNHTDLSAPVTVTSDGGVPVPLAGEVVIEGLSESRASDRIVRALRPYLKHPEVNVRILQQGQSIFFTGSMIGVQPYQPGETLGSAIGAFTAQGQNGAQNGVATATVRTESIDLRRVRIQRGTTTTPPIDLEELARTGGSGPRLQPGDVVLLAAKPVRVDVRGDVKSPATVYLYPDESVNQAVNEAGGFQATSSLAAISLRRDGVEHLVTAAGPEFTGAAHDGDVVTIRPAPRVSVLGSVAKPGDTTLRVGSTVLSALYEAGGPSKNADLKHIKVVHDGAATSHDLTGLTRGDVSADMPVRDGDVIFVPQGRHFDPAVFFQALGALAPWWYGVVR